MTHSEFFLASNYSLFDEVIIYSYFCNMGYTKNRYTLKEWRRLAEWALYYYCEDNA